MAWGALSWARIGVESSYGSANTFGGTEGTDYIWLRLTGDTSMNATRTPEQFTIRSADGGNRKVQRGSAFHGVNISFTIPFYPTQANFLLPAAINLTSNDLPSYTIDFYDSVRHRRFLGWKCQTLTISGSAQSQIMTLAMSGPAQTTAADPTISAPTNSNFPSVLPYTFQETSTSVYINNVARTNYNSVNFTVNNILAPRRMELGYISACTYCGRDVAMQLGNLYAATTDTAAWEATTALGASNQLKWVKGGYSVTLDLEGVNYFSTLNKSIPLGAESMQDLSVDVFYSGADSTDITLTTDVTP